MKACPFCSKSIQDAAVKCRWCGQWIEPSPEADETRIWRGQVQRPTSDDRNRIAPTPAVDPPSTDVSAFNGRNDGSQPPPVAAGKMVYAACPACQKRSSFHCPNCASATQFTLTPNGATCACGAEVALATCACGTGIDKKFFAHDRNLEARDRLGAAARQKEILQRRAQEASGAEPPTPVWKKALWTVAAIFVGFIVYAGVCSEDARERNFCEAQLRNGLKDPKSAEFSDWNTYTWKDNDKTSRITVKVRAQNAFGAFLTKTMACHYDKQGRFEGIDSE